MEIKHSLWILTCVEHQCDSTEKSQTLALASAAQLVGMSSCNQKIEGLILGQGTCLGYRFDPQSGHV